MSCRRLSSLLQASDCWNSGIKHHGTSTFQSRNQSKQGRQSLFTKAHCLKDHVKICGYIFQVLKILTRLPSTYRLFAFCVPEVIQGVSYTEVWSRRAVLVLCCKIDPIRHDAISYRAARRLSLSLHTKTPETLERSFAFVAPKDVVAVIGVVDVIGGLVVAQQADEACAHEYRVPAAVASKVACCCQVAP
eukprot:1844274-Amphidinium_carterae.1